MANLADQFERLNKKLHDVVQETVIEFADRSVEYLRTPSIKPGAEKKLASPVWSAAFITSHRVNVGSVDTSISFDSRIHDRVDEDMADTLHRISQYPLDARKNITTQGFKVGDTVFISNSSTHANDLEESASPWHKTPGDIYNNIARTVSEEMLSDGKRDAANRVKSKYTPAQKVQIKVKI